MIDDIFLARQPILDEDRATFGYELLYRSNASDESAMVTDPDAATQAVVERTLLDWGIDTVVGDRFGFINVGPDIFSSGLYRALPAEGIVAEVRATAPVDDEMVDALVLARREGYHIALDHVQSLDVVKNSRILEHASMIKVDIAATPASEIQQIVRLGKQVNPQMKFIAERVETYEQFDISVTLGFELFQGYFFAKPQLLSRRARPANAVAALNLLAEVQKPDIDIGEIEELVGRDPTLAFKLLGVVNSCSFGLSRRVGSLRQAIVLLGLRHVRDLAMLLTLSATDDVSGELVLLGATRARLCALLAEDPKSEASGSDVAFTVGLLSVTDALYGTTLEELMEELPVEPQVTAALLDGVGPLAKHLEIARACERGDVDTLTDLVGDRLDEVLKLSSEALQWADDFRSEVGDKRSKVRLEPSKPDAAEVDSTPSDLAVAAPA